MPAVHLTSKSKSDLLSIASYLLAESGSIELTTRYIEDLEKGIHSLSKFAYLGSLTSHPILSLKKYRFLRIHRYVVIYRVIEDEDLVVIVRILHQKSIQFLQE